MEQPLVLLNSQLVTTKMEVGLLKMGLLHQRAVTKHCQLMQLDPLLWVSRATLLTERNLMPLVTRLMGHSLDPNLRVIRAIQLMELNLAHLLRITKPSL